MKAPILLLVALTAGGSTTGRPTPTPRPEAGAPVPISVGETPPVVVAVGAATTVRVPLTIAAGYRIQANPASDQFLVPLEVHLEVAGGCGVGRADAVQRTVRTRAHLEMAYLSRCRRDGVPEARRGFRGCCLESWFQTRSPFPSEALDMSKVAVVQTPPVLLDRGRTLEKAVHLVGEAAAEGADLVVFPETFVAGYPIWMWRLRPGTDMALTNQLYGRLFASAVDLESADLAPLQAAAREHSVTVVCGMNERDGGVSRGTLYNTVVVVDASGNIVNRHRKLMPTNPERMVHGFGDGSGLKAIDTPAGRIGTLLCWENYMPLARYALYAQGVEVYVAPTYDSGDAWIGTLQHIAREGRCWVVGSGFVMRVADIPDDFPEKARLYPDADAWVNPGDSLVIGPDGVTTAGPMHQDIGILYAEVEPSNVAVARRSLDVAGHYSRPDVFELRVNAAPQKSFALKD